MEKRNVANVNTVGSVPTFRSKLSFSGKTVDGRLTISGLSFFTNTEGLPLEIVLMWCQGHNYVPDWIDYIHGCLRDGHKLKTIKSRIVSACHDIYGRDHANEMKLKIADLVEL